MHCDANREDALWDFCSLCGRNGGSRRVSQSHYFTLVHHKEKNILVKCKLCECSQGKGMLPGQLSASLAVMLLLQEEHRVVEETVREVKR